MALVTVQRSPCGSSTNNIHERGSDDIDGSGNNEKGQATETKSVSECYFAVKGAALVLPHDECLHIYRKPITNGASDIQQHLQTMLYLLHDDDILKMAVKLESIHNGRTRYLVVASRTGKQQTEESCLLGIDCNKQTSIGLVLPVWADTRITLDGDGGFSVTSSGRHHIFKPVSVQAMWSALQMLHKASSQARQCNYFKGGGTHHWIDYYEARITSDRSCLNEWHAMDDLESKRPPSPDTDRSQPTEREETEKRIRAKLKELMMSLDLDETTSKYIRTRLEEILDMNLKEFKSFIDQEMLTILGQMDAPTEIFQYLYLGSEWNASNLEELVLNGIGHILNVTREIDNFFPGMFDYENIRVYDDESTEILHYWDTTYRYIQKAKDEGSKVLVHCKMGISRSASVVIAYVMKAYDWNLQQALEFVKNKRNCIKPNSGFLKQLEIYQGILDASKHRHNSLWRSKSETNLKSHDKPKKEKSKMKDDGLPVKSESLMFLQLPRNNSRPKSWSPNDSVADMLFPPNGSISSETLSKDIFRRSYGDQYKQLANNEGTDFLVAVKRDSDSLCEKRDNVEQERCSNSDHLQVQPTIPRVSSIKDRINELELQVSSSPEVKPSRIEAKSPSSQNRSGLVLNLATQFESVSKPSSPTDDGLIMKPSTEEIVEPVLSQTKPPVPKHHAVLVKPAIWSDDTSKTCLTSNATNNPSSAKVITAKSATSRQPEFSSGLFSCCKKQTETAKNGISMFSKSLPVESIFNAFDKTSHDVSNSAFKPVPARGRTHSLRDPVTTVYPNVIVSSGICLTSERFIEPGLSLAKIQVSGKVTDKPFSCSKGQSHFLSSTASAHKKHEALPSQHKMSPVYDPFSEHNASQNVPCKVNLIYDKESIPFKPGTVQRTRKQLEEKSLTRTTSFDSGFPLNMGLMPSTDLDYSWQKPVRRSHSLRNDSRSSSIFSRKWFPLPALASDSPKPLKTSKELTSPLSQNRMSTEHSVSTPSVVEAVNQVICGTQEIISSAIQSMPLDKGTSRSLCHTSTDSSIEFGSVSSLPDVDVEDVIFVSRSPSARSESPIPGMVRQQCELLENKSPKPSKSDTAKHRCEASLVSDVSSLVSSDLTCKSGDGKDLGIVKRLTKELEAKSSSELHCKEKNSSGESDISKSKPQDKSSVGTCKPHGSPDIGLGPRQPTGLRSSLPTSVEKKLSCNVGTQIVAPPTPHRKTSLDLNFLRKVSRFPLTTKLRNPTKSEPGKDLESTADCRFSGNVLKSSNVQKTTQYSDVSVQVEPKTDKYKVSCGRPPPAVKLNPVSSSDIPSPPPPPAGPPRKIMRKQHGSTHPLSRLTMRQRHTNPVYNTM